MKDTWVLTKKYTDKHTAQRNLRFIREMFPELVVELEDDTIQSSNYLGLAEALNKIENNGVKKHTPNYKHTGRY
ncbi:MAG: hypothetical protein KAQ87_00450 [Candidatus Pacebacteria bacterium]|nr:hypothetical protein [Candidatus Paceibacterota bacterium]